MKNTANIPSIVFVHGLGSNPDTTWRAEKQAIRLDSATDSQSNSNQYVNWVSDLLPKDLLPTTRQDTRIFFYNYDSYWKRDAVHTRLSNLGNELLEYIKIGIRQSDEVRIENNRSDPVDITDDLIRSEAGT
jgi:hypothetical protein